MPIPFLLWGLGAAGAAALGGVLGYASRNSEVERLKGVIRALQAENRRLQAIIREQQEQIETLKEKYKAAHKLNFINKQRYARQLNEALVESYIRKEQLEVIFKKASGALTDAENRFFELTMQESRDEKESMELLDYINKKYGREIRARVYPEKSLNNAVDNINNLPS